MQGYSIDQPWSASPDLHTWLASREPDSGMRWREDALAQFAMVAEAAPSARVVGVHKSKGINLPVYGLAGEHAVAALRGNFIDWIFTAIVADARAAHFGLLASSFGGSKARLTDGFPSNLPWPAGRPGAKFTVIIPNDDGLLHLLHTARSAAIF